MAIIPVFIYMSIFIVGLPVLIGVYVYRDAVQRGMNAALWTLVAVLAPAFVGFIIYLLVRSGYSDLKCPNCEAAVTEQYRVCPKCGTKLKASCPGCNLPVEPDWTVCPHCSSPLQEYMDGFTPPIRKNDRTLGKILLVVILVPILLLILLGLFSFSSFSSSSSMNVAYLNIDNFAGRPEITSWISTCDKDTSKIYALRYQTRRNEQKATHYLIYRPLADKNTDISASYNSGLFGANIKVRFNNNAGQNIEGTPLTCISNYSDKYAGLKIFSGNQKQDCQITDVEYNPALFEVGPEKEKPPQQMTE